MCSHKNTSFYINHLNPSNYKNLFILLIYVSLHKKYQRSSCVFFTKHYISYQKQLNPSNYKTCLYKLFVYLYTKIPKTILCFFHKNTIFQKSSCVLTKNLNPSNYKTCLYNLFVHLYTKKYQRPSCVFSQKHYISKILMCSHKTLKSE